VPRVPPIDGIANPEGRELCRRGARCTQGRAPRPRSSARGGIGFDVAEFLSAGDAADGHASDGRADDPAVVAFRAEWGIDATYAMRGGLMPALDDAPSRMLWLLQRKETKVGAGLAKTTGWIRRTLLKRRGVTMLAGVAYDRVDDGGLHITVDGSPQVLDVDTVVICAGQEPRRDLVPALAQAGIEATLIGGADVAAELDAKRCDRPGHARRIVVMKWT
jgi:2,4-dienoyl-CoA reductase (NADPH2)